MWLDEDEGDIRSVHRGYDGLTYWRVYTDLEQTLGDVDPIELEIEYPVFGSFSRDGSLLAIVTESNNIEISDGMDGTLLETLILP